MKIFEYTELTAIATAPITRWELNDLGKQGWELCAIDERTFIFKRLKQIDYKATSEDE
jgi:hypothetical protein